MSKNKKIIIGLVLAAAALAFLMFSSIPATGSKEIAISDLVKNAKKYRGEVVMTQGLLNAKTVKWDADKIELEFEIYDDGKHSLPVFHKGIKPDNFSNDIIVIVEGFMREDGVFEAEKVQTKCPSKYESADMKNYDPKTHQKILKEKQE
ncbi:MAG: cytochrome c maturation protein CcmE [Thermoactinomyces sp.]